MCKIKEYLKKHDKELISYFIFGVLTTVVGMTTYFGLLAILKKTCGVANDDTTSTTYVIINAISQVVHWIAAVLFAFFTNRKWVFTDAERDVPMFPQLLKFAGGRLFTFGIDTIGTLLGPMCIAALIPVFVDIQFLGLNLAEFTSKILVSVIVMICNYILSKIFVFKEKK